MPIANCSLPGLTFFGKSQIGNRQSKIGNILMAERVGFEPTERFPAHSISSAANSTTLAPLPEEFRIPDELWARIVYDFALAYRLRTIARDHLLRALTPLYLGWIASYAVEVESAGRSAVQRRWERLCGAYESGKPYFVSRWRWPDRFNP